MGTFTESRFQTRVLEDGENQDTRISLGGNKLTFTDIRTNHPARVRIYVTAAKQATDLNRGPWTTARSSAGLILDVVTGVDDLDLALNPDALGIVVDGYTVPVTVTNLSGEDNRVIVYLTGTSTIELLELQPPQIVVTELDSDLLAKSHKIATYAEVLVDDAAIYTDLPIIDGSVTLDAGSAARGRVNLTVPGIDELIPTDPDSPLNVYSTEVAVYRGIRTVEADLIVPLGKFGITQSTVRDAGGDLSIAISGLDRMGRFIAPESAFEEAGEIAAGTLAGTAVIDVFTAAWPDMPYNEGEFDAITVPLPALTYEEGEDRSVLGIGIATAIGHELYFDGRGELRIRPVPSVTGANPVAEITEGEGGTLLSVDRDFDRSRVINRWTVTGQNPENDPGAPIPRGVAVDDNPASPTYYFGQNTSGRTFGRRLDSYDNSFIGSDTQAEDAAAGLLARSIGAPDQVSFGAVVDPVRAPSDVVWIERTRLGLAAAHILDTVTIPLTPEGEMTATTRITQVLE